jgi:hypothetical protein
VRTIERIENRPQMMSRTFAGGYFFKVFGDLLSVMAIGQFGAAGAPLTAGITITGFPELGVSGEIDVSHFCGI